MRSDADFLVVGAGVIGCAVARALARRGARVEILEARRVGAGATQASAGVLAPYIEAHEGGDLLDLTVRSLGLYDAWIDEIRADSGIEVEYGRFGTLEVALDEAAAQRLAGMPHRFSAHEEMAWLDAAAARAAEPALGSTAIGGLLVARHAYVAAPELTAALARSAERHGARFHAGVRITTVMAAGDHVDVTADDGTTWRADRVVIAAGSWSSQIADPGGSPARCVRPVRGQLLRVAWRGQPLVRVVWGPACYVVPWRDGTVLVGATMEEVGFEERATVSGVRALLTAACELLPAMAEATFLDVRSGLRPGTPDRLPIVGLSPGSPRVLHATGHFRNGILLAPLTAALIANLVFEGGTDPALATLSPGRASLN